MVMNVLDTAAIQPIDLKEEQWKLKANCQGMDTEEYFGSGPGHTYPPILATICNRCEVKAECLAYATKYYMQGYWANTVDKQRQQLRK